MMYYDFYLNLSAAMLARVHLLHYFFFKRVQNKSPLIRCHMKEKLLVNYLD